MYSEGGLALITLVPMNTALHDPISRAVYCSNFDLARVNEKEQLILEALSSGAAGIRCRELCRDFSGTGKTFSVVQMLSRGLQCLQGCMCVSDRVVGR